MDNPTITAPSAVVRALMRGWGDDGGPLAAIASGGSAPALAAFDELRESGTLAGAAFSWRSLAELAVVRGYLQRRAQRARHES